MFFSVRKLINNKKNYNESIYKPELNLKTELFEVLLNVVCLLD